WHPPVPTCVMAILIQIIHSARQSKKLSSEQRSFWACPAWFSCLFSFSIGGCGPPTRLHFAELKEEHKNEIDFSVGKTVQYTCHPGYAKQAGMSPTITCLETGVWSEVFTILCIHEDRLRELGLFRAPGRP
uniref:Sushi domain-containing protein n=1 Tax=Amazona collaria TaxID=241587 RepID=A0A8B9F2S2_9PSIT